MLETVRQTIADLPFISFEQFYSKYVLDIHDLGLDVEVRTLLRNNNIDSISICRLIDSISKGGAENG